MWNNLDWVDTRISAPGLRGYLNLGTRMEVWWYMGVGKKTRWRHRPCMVDFTHPKNWKLYHLLWSDTIKNNKLDNVSESEWFLCNLWNNRPSGLYKTPPTLKMSDHDKHFLPELNWSQPNRTSNVTLTFSCQWSLGVKELIPKSWKSTNVHYLMLSKARKW